MKSFDILTHVRNFWSHITCTPPHLRSDYSRSDYVEFMKKELFLLTPAYTKRRVRIKGKQNFLRAVERANVIIALLHHGSWLLIGGVVRHLLGVPYTVIASRRNFDVMSDEDKRFWTAAHNYIQSFYGEEFIFSDQPAFRLMRWFKPRPAVLGVAFDVREYNQSPTESPIEFAGTQLWVQTRPARVATLAKVLVVPASIHYNPGRRVHELEFHDVIDPRQIESEQALTQAVFSALEPVYTAYQEQSFFDLTTNFSRQHEPISS